MTSTMKTGSAALSGLPAPFLDAMRKLFDIMDSDNAGWIHIDGNSIPETLGVREVMKYW